VQINGTHMLHYDRRERCAGTHGMTSSGLKIPAHSAAAADGALYLYHLIRVCSCIYTPVHSHVLYREAPDASSVHFSSIFVLRVAAAW